jgi:hypothetical protein
VRQVQRHDGKGTHTPDPGPLNAFLDLQNWVEVGKRSVELNSIWDRDCPHTGPAVKREGHSGSRSWSAALDGDAFECRSG